MTAKKGEIITCPGIIIYSYNFITGGEKKFICQSTPAYEITLKIVYDKNQSANDEIYIRNLVILRQIIEYIMTGNNLEYKIGSYYIEYIDENGVFYEFYVPPIFNSSYNLSYSI